MSLQRSVRGPVLVAAIVLLGCDQDPLHLSERRIAGAFRLKQWEDGSTYYLVTPETRGEGGGAIEGTVRRIGWDSVRIVVQRRPLVGDSLDWMMIDLASGAIAGPYASAPAVAGAVPLFSPDSAWARLK